MPPPHIEANEVWIARYADACARFKQREISVHVFRAELKTLRFLPHEIDTEVNLNWPNGGTNGKGSIHR